jgi:uncharacterized protein
MYVLAMEVDLRVADAHSLKDKRQVVRSLLEQTRRRFGVSAAEVGAQESWQRARLGFAVVASAAHHAEAVLDEVDRFIWSNPAVEVLDAERTWLG